MFHNRVPKKRFICHDICNGRYNDDRNLEIKSKVRTKTSRKVKADMWYKNFSGQKNIWYDDCIIL